jgi:hypothetical protein
VLERTQAKATIKERELAFQLEEKDREFTHYKQQIEHDFYNRE